MDIGQILFEILDPLSYAIVQCKLGIEKLLSSLLRKIYLQYHLHVVDHACLRLLWPNLAHVGGFKGVFRSGHPNFKMLKKLKELGVTTVLNLRGGEHKLHNIVEQKRCEMLGMKYTNIQLSAVKLPSKQVLLNLIEFFENQTDPFLMHCKSGADRSGLASGVYLIVVKHVPVELAMRQLSVRYLHFGLGRKSNLRNFFRYVQKTKSKEQSFKDWVHNSYDPKRIIVDS